MRVTLSGCFVIRWGPTLYGIVPVQEGCVQGGNLVLTSGIACPPLRAACLFLHTFRVLLALLETFMFSMKGFTGVVPGTGSDNPMLGLEVGAWYSGLFSL